MIEHNYPVLNGWNLMIQIGTQLPVVKLNS